MNQRLATALILVAAVVAQVAIAPHLAIAGVVPNILLLVVLTLALVGGRTQGVVVGFVAGLLADLLGTGVIGVAALVFTVIGYMAGSLQENMFAEGWLLPVSVVLIASLLAEFSYALVLALLGEGAGFGMTLTRIVIPTALYTAALALVLYPFLARFLRTEQTMTTFRRIGRGSRGF